MYRAFLQRFLTFLTFVSNQVHPGSLETVQRIKAESSNTLGPPSTRSIDFLEPNTDRTGPEWESFFSHSLHGEGFFQKEIQ